MIYCRRVKIFIAIAATALIPGCNFRYIPFVEDEIRATERAGFEATLSAIRGEDPELTPIPPLREVENKLCGIVDCSTKTPTPPLAEATLTPVQHLPESPEGKVTIVGEREWVWYYSDQDITDSKKIGQLRSGSSWEVAQQTEDAVRIMLLVWLPQEDLSEFQNKTSVKPCMALNHSWGHRSDRSLCHTHAWGNNNKIRATIPTSMSGIVIEGPTVQRYKNTQTGEWTFGPLVKVEIEQEVWIPAQNSEESN